MPSSRPTDCRPGSFVGAKPSVGNHPARLRDLAFNDLEPGRQKALALAMSKKRIAQLASLQFAYDHAIGDQLVERFKIDTQVADGRSHRAQRNVVGAAMLEAFQQLGKFPHLDSDFSGTLGVIGWRRRSKQGRRGRSNPFGLS